jgi:hypothetical protein
MNETPNSPVCERASDLIAFVYNETTESEKRDFELHLKECSNCRQEIASFGLVRESISAWRDEALSGFVAQPPIAATRKSALAAFRQFFDLSPLWLKAATGFAVLSFCVLAVLAVVKVPTKGPVLTNISPDKIYTGQEVDRNVKEALPAIQEEPVKTPRITRKKADERSRRPLSRAERDQLAADLRLTADDSLDLLSDRINQ